MEREIYKVWMDQELKIATFREEPGYKLRTFTSRKKFMEYLRKLSAMHFRFK